MHIPEYRRSLLCNTMYSRTLLRSPMYIRTVLRGLKYVRSLLRSLSYDTHALGSLMCRRTLLRSPLPSFPLSYASSLNSTLGKYFLKHFVPSSSCCPCQCSQFWDRFILRMRRVNSWIRYRWRAN